MKYLRKYESNGFDADFAVAKIRDHFSEEEVASMIEEEIGEWADEEFYSKNGNGEAEEVVICQMIAWFKREFSRQLSVQEESLLEDELRHVYECIN
jgi:hypothetical protein